jgi:acetyltransferase-like isoleucine patch superfamily enzyme
MYRKLFEILLRTYDGLKNFMCALLYVLSELESLIVRPNGNPSLRRAFLRINNIRFGKYCFFGHGFHLYKSNAQLVIGERSCFGENCGIYLHDDIEIGDDFLAAPRLTINNGSHNIETLEPTSAKVRIGNRVWCGVNVTIVAGANIGDDCVIGANSLVLSDIPPRSLAVGIPARIIKQNIRTTPKVWSCYTN